MDPCMGGIHGADTINEIQAKAHDLSPKCGMCSLASGSIHDHSNSNQRDRAADEVVTIGRHTVDPPAPGDGKGDTDRLYAKIGQLNMELDWLKKSLG